MEVIFPQNQWKCGLGIAQAGELRENDYWHAILLCALIRVNISPSRKSVAYRMTNGVLFMSVRFTQSCPTCGRRIQVRASLMGCEVRCQHCDAVFVAQHDETRPDLSKGEPRPPVLWRDSGAQ